MLPEVSESRQVRPEEERQDEQESVVLEPNVLVAAHVAQPFDQDRGGRHRGDA
jgi:hypothetical protein